MGGNAGQGAGKIVLPNFSLIGWREIGSLALQIFRGRSVRHWLRTIQVYIDYLKRTLKCFQHKIMMITTFFFNFSNLYQKIWVLPLTYTIFLIWQQFHGILKSISGHALNVCQHYLVHVKPYLHSHISIASKNNTSLISGKYCSRVTMWRNANG